MLIIKTLNVFIALILFIITFSILFFLLSKLPKAEVEIVYKPIFKPSIPLEICKILQTKFKCLEKCKEEIKNELSKFYSNFEIVIGNEIIRHGNLPFSEEYDCLVFSEKVKKVIIKI
jgi:hypothetical protein